MQKNWIVAGHAKPALKEQKLKDYLSTSLYVGVWGIGCGSNQVRKGCKVIAVKNG